MDFLDNEKLNIIAGRRSIRQYTGEDVTDENLRIILEAAMAAPSAVAKDPWRFIVVRKQDTRNNIASVLPNGQMLKTAALGIVVCGDVEAAHGRAESYMLQDCSAAIQNILLAVHGLGLGGCWLGVHPREERISHINSIFSLPENIIPVAVIAIGHSAKYKNPRTRFKAEYVHNEEW